MAEHVIKANRREFLAGTSAGAASLVIGTTLVTKARAQAAGAVAASPNAFVKVDADGIVTVMVKHIEFGQGPLTGLSTLVADEMDADWSQVRGELAPANVQLYANSSFGVQGTGGSTAMANSYAQMRRAGAQARAVLVAAAAQQWGVPASEISVSEGTISHSGSGRSSGFGEFVATAAALEVPENPPLKAKADRTLIGKSVPKLDTASKTDGTATYTIDVFRDGMLTVAVLHPPVFGATLKAMGEQDALAVKGVVAVEQTSHGIAVYAENTFAAFKGRAALKPEWDVSTGETRSSATITKDYTALANSGPGIIATDEGDVATALSGAAQRIDATYIFPYLAHTPMEPLDAVAEYTDDGVEMWMGSQLQTVDQMTVQQVMGYNDLSKVKINTMMAGGSFGRRAQPTSHLAAEAAEILKASPSRRPVKLLWTREDDVHGGYYRALTVHKVSAGLDASGAIVRLGSDGGDTFLPQGLSVRGDDRRGWA